MIICSCNLISEKEIREVIHSLLDSDPWQLIVPVQVYHELEKRGRCCGCFPRVVDVIVDVTQNYHRTMQTDERSVIKFIDKLKQKHHQCETARMLAKTKLAKIRAA